jgi:hypothetical protein
MVTVMYACPRCGQQKAAEVDPGKMRPRGRAEPGQAPEVTCQVCGTTMKPVSRACDCGMEMR